MIAFKVIAVVCVAVIYSQYINAQESDDDSPNEMESEAANDIPREDENMPKEGKEEMTESPESAVSPHSHESPEFTESPMNSRPYMPRNLPNYPSIPRFPQFPQQFPRFNANPNFQTPNFNPSPDANFNPNPNFSPNPDPNFNHNQNPNPNPNPNPIQTPNVNPENDFYGERTRILILTIHDPLSNFTRAQRYRQHLQDKILADLRKLEQLLAQEMKSNENSTDSDEQLKQFAGDTTKFCEALESHAIFNYTQIMSPYLSSSSSSPFLSRFSRSSAVRPKNRQRFDPLSIVVN